MTPAEILSHLSPQERDTALKAFLAVRLMPREQMTREDWDCLRLAHYDEMADEIIGQAQQSAERDGEAVGLTSVMRQATPNHLLFNGTARAA
ncbi:hypothetical protein ACU4HD_12140 [Cupriavidus basilensis]